MKMSLQKRKSLYGYGFVAVWFIGAAVFFMIPAVQSLIYSFQDIKPDTGGMDGTFAGFSNYSYALNEDQYYRHALFSVLKTSLWRIPLIMALSLFAAVLLNGKFRGRTFARAVFFLPVIIASGPVYEIISGNMQSTGSGGSERFSSMLTADLLDELLEFMGIGSISPEAVHMLESFSEDIFGIIWHSGVQILMFLAALQNIPHDAAEAARIEGASEWEFFWKITLPSVSPMVLACFVFSVTDSFTDPKNEVMRRIGQLRLDWKFGEASAMAWMYFAVVLAALGIISAVINRYVIYENE